MLKGLRDRGTCYRGRGRDHAFSFETEAKTKTFSLEAEARPRRLKFQLRRDQAEALLRLDTASRARRQDRGHIPGKNPYLFNGVQDVFVIFGYSTRRSPQR